MDRAKNLVKNKDSIRELVLKVKDGDKPISTSGAVDNRLFSGENKLWAVMDKKSSLWYVKYQSGIIPQPLQQRWTSFNKLLDFTKSYFDRRNIEITEVID